MLVSFGDLAPSTVIDLFFFLGAESLVKPTRGRVLLVQGWRLQSLQGCVCVRLVAELVVLHLICGRILPVHIA